MALMGKLEQMNKEEVIEFVKAGQHENGGFSASINHDPHLLYSLSAVQVCDFKNFLRTWKDSVYDAAAAWQQKLCSSIP